MEFDVKMNSSALYDYMMHHTYSGFLGVFGSGVGAVLIVVFAMSGNVYCGIMGVIVFLYNPISLYWRSKKQAKLNPAFKEPLHYVFDEEGVTVSQNDVSQCVRWEDMFKATSSNRSIFLYTSRVNAWVFPKSDLGERKNDLIEIISKHMSPTKVRIRQ